MAKYSKLKLFLFLVSFVVIIVFVVQVSNILKDGFDTINIKKKALSCTNLKYEIIQSEYNNNNLIIELTSSTHKYNISKVTIISDLNERKHVTMLDPVLTNSGTALFQINNITLNKSYNVYVEDCKESVLNKEI